MHAGLDSSGIPLLKVFTFWGGEFAVLLDRLVVTERFFKCEWGLTSQTCLVPLGEPECDAVA